MYYQPVYIDQAYNFPVQEMNTACDWDFQVKGATKGDSWPQASKPTQQFQADIFWPSTSCFSFDQTGFRVASSQSDKWQLSWPAA